MVNYNSVKTSQSHPLQIATIALGGGLGRIGITFCPGKTQSGAYSGAWARDLDADLDVIMQWNASAVVSLIEAHEFAALAVKGLGATVQARHMDWFHLPIADFQTPCARFEAEWQAAGRNLRHRLRNGFDVLIHCKGGLGRAGSIAARLLVELGVATDQAITMVRSVRPGAIETGSQERYVRAVQPVSVDTPAQSRAAIEDRGMGALIGLAVGDAVGTALEFKPRDSYPRLTDMIGGGVFQLKPGEWTDDTAMALALADSLLVCGGINEADLMQRFVNWRERGAYSCTGTCFDIGNTTSAALRRWQRTGDPIAGDTDPDTAGNGSLMRLAPVALRYWDDRTILREAAARQSRTTHAAPQAVAGCVVYAEMIADAIAGCPAHDVLQRAANGMDTSMQVIIDGAWRGKRRDKIRASGYVLHSLEAAIWSVARTGSFAEAVLTAANLGEDADTTAAIAGQLAGALYGASGIPAEWRGKLAWGDKISATARQLLAR